MATKKAPTKTVTKKKAAPAKKKSAQPKKATVTPATEKAIKKVHKRMTKFVTDPYNDKEQVEIYFGEINTFIEEYKNVGSKSPKQQ